MRVYVFHKSFSTIQSHLLKEIPLAVELKVSIFRFWWTVRKKYVISLKNKTKKSGLWYFDTNDVLFLLKTKEKSKGHLIYRVVLQIWFFFSAEWHKKTHSGFYYYTGFNLGVNQFNLTVHDYIHRLPEFRLLLSQPTLPGPTTRRLRLPQRNYSSEAVIYWFICFSFNCQQLKHPLPATVYQSVNGKTH